MEAGISYRPRGLDGVECTLITKRGNWLSVTGWKNALKPEVDGSEALCENQALINSLWACAMHQLRYRRSRSSDRKTHLKRSGKHGSQAKVIAQMAEKVGGRSRAGWCSACLNFTTHEQVRGFSKPQSTYLCLTCGSPTTPCAAPRCGSMANRRYGVVSGPRYCAEHRHDVCSFARLTESLDSIEQYESWLTYDKRNLTKVTKLLAGIAVTGVALAPVAFLAAPMIGGVTGALSGLSGAAATSHGLALWGGGALAAGGLGMAGGTAVITAVGGGLGGALGAVTTNTYIRTDPSFAIEKLQDGAGTPVLLISGFLTENNDGWGDWQSLIDQRYHDHPVYRVHWGAKELAAIAFLLGRGAGKQAAQKALRRLAAKAGKKAARVPGLGLVLLTSDLATNPWSVAKYRAAMTGAVLADLIARTEEQQFILVGHSLGARVAVTAAQALGTREKEDPKIETMHLLGAAVGAKGDWDTLNDAVEVRVWNYWSDRDRVLRNLYRTAQAGQSAAGAIGLRLKKRHLKISNRKVARTVGSHSEYFTGVTLQ